MVVLFRTLATRRRVAASKGVGKSFGAKFRLRNSKPVFAVKRWRRNFRGDASFGRINLDRSQQFLKKKHSGYVTNGEPSPPGGITGPG